MASNAVLKLVENTSFYRRDFQFWDSSSKNSTHSLHSLIPHTNSTRAEIANYFINSLSEKGDIILDPFCGAGTIPLEASLNGRVPYYSDVDPFSLSIASAKLQPVDITQVTLFLQQANLKKPVSMTNYTEYFSEFYDIDTYREIINLKKLVLNSYDGIARFVEVLALSLLHGNNAGYFSIFTNPNAALTPEEQKKFNIQRHQRPEYRALIPRILKKTAYATSDGLPSVLEKMSDKGMVKRSDARNLNYLSSESVGMIMTSPPLPGSEYSSTSQWLKHWFSDIDAKDFSSNITSYNNMEDWNDFMNETLLEFARVVPSGKHSVIHLKDVYLDSKLINTADKFIEMVKSDMSNFWTVEGIVSNKVSQVQINALKSRDSSNRSLVDRAVVLKRK